MKKLILLLPFLCCFNILSPGQNNMQDSTFQAIGYWNVNEKESYTVTLEKYKVQNGDTINREFYKYDVDITVTDSTADSYTIEWNYGNIEVKAYNELIEKLSKTSKISKAIIRTDEFGAFEELVNWEGIRDEVKRLLTASMEEFSNIPNFDKLIEQTISMYSTKESIENNIINEIQQFYSFHGGKYKFGEYISTAMQIPNNYGGKPFDTAVDIWLDEMNPEDSNAVIRMTQTVDQIQLMDATYTYLSNMAATLGTEIPKKETLPVVSHQTYVTSIIHDTGWIIYSINDKIIESDNIQRVEQQIIELK